MKHSRKNAIKKIESTVSYFKRGKKIFRISLFCKNSYVTMNGKEIFPRDRDLKFSTIVEEVPVLGY